MCLYSACNTKLRKQYFHVDFELLSIKFMLFSSDQNEDDETLEIGDYSFYLLMYYVLALHLSFNNWT